MTTGILVILGWTILFPPSAHAYLDPGNGSMMIQLLLAGFAGIAVGLNMFWRRIVSFFSRTKSASKNNPKKPS